MKVVVNRCYGGFGLSHAAIMRYAELSGIKLFPFTEARKEDGRTDFRKFVPYTGQKETFLIHYSTQPLTSDGKYQDNTYWSYPSDERSDTTLIQVIEEMGESANGTCAKLEILEIPDDVQYEIDDYDGMESIHEKHRSW